MTVLVTGATGFVGRALVARLVRDAARDAARDDTSATLRATTEGAAAEYDRETACGSSTVRACARHAAHDWPESVEPYVIGDITRVDDWGPALRGVSDIVHLAARVHVMREDQAVARSAYQAVNVDATTNLARAAARKGVRRFVFVSSIKVHGDSTVLGAPFNEQSPVIDDAGEYARSKLGAELALRDIAATSGMELVIVRPPLVYGAGVGANFAALARLVKRGWPLPFAAVDNRRSMIGRENLADFIATCLTNPAAANETFVISDGEDLSTPELVRRIAQAQGRTVRLFTVPQTLLCAAAALLGRADIAQRLTQSLQVDSSKARRVLSWSPLHSVDSELLRMFHGTHASAFSISPSAR